MMRRWISPFDLYESSTWRNTQKAKSRNPEESDKSAIRLVREAVCNGSRNSLLIMAESSIQGGLTSELEGQMQ